MNPPRLENLCVCRATHKRRRWSSKYTQERGREFRLKQPSSQSDAPARAQRENKGDSGRWQENE